MKLPLEVDFGCDELSDNHYTVLISDATGTVVITVHGETADEAFERAEMVVAAFNCN